MLSVMRLRVFTSVNGAGPAKPLLIVPKSIKINSSLAVHGPPIAHSPPPPMTHPQLVGPGLADVQAVAITGPPEKADASRRGTLVSTSPYANRRVTSSRQRPHRSTPRRPRNGA